MQDDKSYEEAVAAKLAEVDEKFADHKAFLAVSKMLATRPMNPVLALDALDELIKAPIDETERVFSALLMTFPNKEGAIVGMAQSVSILRQMRALDPEIVEAAMVSFRERG